ncbi:MAG: hypothetical protein U1F43_09365 [Myxococcota bacterium]
MRHALALVAFALLIGIAACGSTGGGGIVCSGGAYQVDNGCFCPLGMLWQDGQCQGQPQAGNCSGGAFQAGSQCFCPVGMLWNAEQAQCLAIVCSGGAFVAGYECRCPDGKQWIDQACQVPCVPNAYHADPDTCLCPDGTSSYGDALGCLAPCPGSSQYDASGQCMCPVGTSWDGNDCAAVVAAPEPPPTPWQPPPEPPQPYEPGPGPGPSPGRPGQPPGPSPGPMPGFPPPRIERWEMPHYPSPPFVARYGPRCKEFLQSPNNKAECMSFCTSTIQTGVSQGCTCMDLLEHCDGTRDKPVRVQ